MRLARDQAVAVELELEEPAVARERLRRVGSASIGLDGLRVDAVARRLHSLDRLAQIGDGAAAEALPVRYGKWSTVHKRFKRWADKGHLANGFQYAGGGCRHGVGDDRFHHRSRPSTRCWRERGQENQALGRSRGGFSTKIHAACDSLGNPLRFILTGGQRNDCTQALQLLEGIRADAVLADKGYDADYIVEAAVNMQAIAVIPPKSNRIIQREYDKELYKERNLVERLYGSTQALQKSRYPLR